MDMQIVFPALPEPHYPAPASNSGGADASHGTATGFTTEQMYAFARATVQAQPARQRDLTVVGMADCMDMVRSELIEAGIVNKATPPMMVVNDVLAHIQKLSASTSKACVTNSRVDPFAITRYTRAERILQDLECPYTEASSGENWRAHAHAWGEAVTAAMRAIREAALAPRDESKAQPAHAALIRAISKYANAYRLDNRKEASQAYDAILLELFDNPVLIEPGAGADENAVENMDNLPQRDETQQAEAQGLFRKFDVKRLDGSDAPGGKHNNCFNFVLDVDHDKHAPAAMRAYAASCRADHPLLAQDIIDRVGIIGTPEEALFAQPVSLASVLTSTWIHEHAKKHCVSYTGNYEMSPGGMLMFAQAVGKLQHQKAAAPLLPATPLTSLIEKYAQILQRHPGAHLKIECVGTGWLVDLHSNTAQARRWLTCGMGATIDEACAQALNEYHEEVTG
jgi:hypothetical protein